MSKKTTPVALCYDFDGTLTRGNMQENSFIPNLDMKKEQFWEEVKEEAKKKDMDEVLAYMELMMRKAKEKKQPFTRDSLKDHGETVPLFPNVKEWFDEINEVGKTMNINVKHYVISSGVDEMIKGSPIGKCFEYIFASGFSYDDDGLPKFAARSVNYTTKTQYLFRINKGILNSWNNDVNKFMKESERPLPFSQMIYFGDGETDVPAMKMLNYQGGYTIAVYPPAEEECRTEEESRKKEIAVNLYNQNRAQFLAEADYSKDKDLFHIVKALLSRISDEEKYGMNRKA